MNLRDLVWPWIILALVATMHGVQAGAQAARVNPDARALKDFADRVQKYGELQRRLDAAAPRVEGSADPAQIIAHQNGLARLIRDARRDAKEGDILFGGVRRVFRKIIQSHFREGDDLSVILLEESPIAITLSVNDMYPAAAPLLTVPAQLLAKLPFLPEGLEYRFVGRDLILRDVNANLVVDVARKMLR